MSAQTQYRNRLFTLLQAANTKHLLEVGCGAGTFLRGAKALGFEVEGIDPNPKPIEALRSEGFVVRLGQAEALDFPDASFDAVVFSYTAHHLANWPVALQEALRVAKTGVFILDPWYDISLPSQVVALEFERWSKAIDRSTGMVHQDCMDAQTLLQPVANRLKNFDITLEHHLLVIEHNAAQLARPAQEQLAIAAQPLLWQAQLDSILNQAQEHCYSDDGAILLTLRKRP